MPRLHAPDSIHQAGRFKKPIVHAALSDAHFKGKSTLGASSHKMGVFFVRVQTAIGVATQEVNPKKLFLSGLLRLIGHP